METPDNKSGGYPTGYTHVGQRVNAILQRVQQVDKQIDNLPQNAKPAPKLLPPGVKQPNRSFNRESTIRYLENERQQTLTEGWNGVEKETPVADDRMARVARDKAREALFPNPYRHLTKEGRTTEQIKCRDIEMSQNYMDAMRLAKAAERSVAPQQAQPVPAIQEEKKTLSLSERYVQKLTQHVRQGRNMVLRGPEPKKE